MINNYYLIIVFGFFSVFLLLEGLYIAWNSSRGPKARSISRRLQLLSAGSKIDTYQKSLIKNRLLSDSHAVEAILLSVPRIHALDRLLIQSGLDLSVAKFLVICMSSYITGMIVFMIIGFPSAFAAALSFLFAAFPVIFIINQRSKRIEKIDTQLPDVMDLIGRALRAGHAFQSAIHMVANESPEPICSEFKTTFDEINFGVSVQNALLNLASRVPSTDLRYFVIAVMIQRDTGGNLAELLDNISRMMRDRMKLLGTVRVLAAEGKLSAWILSLLPFALAFVMSIINPGFMSILFTDPLGHKLLIGAGLMMIFGIFWLWRLTKIHV